MVIRRDDAQELLEVATDLALAAGAVQRQWFDKPLQIATKSAMGDLVSQVDKEAEELVVRALRRTRPHDAILAEEGALCEGSSDIRWIIDPLDGTANYVRGYPAFCVSIAAEVSGYPLVGVVYETLADRLYAGVLDREATCNGAPIIVRQTEALSESVIGTGFSYDPDQRGCQGLVLAQLIRHVADIRRSGSAALDLCHVACGALDGYFELDLAPWDFAAGAVIAGAAGAHVLRLEARHGQGPAIVAASPHLIDELVRLLRAAEALA